jgi:hypothetical protein
MIVVVHTTSTWPGTLVKVVDCRDEDVPGKAYALLPSSAGVPEM